MIIPSIDLIQGEAVQLVGGKEKALGAGDPRPIAEQFRIAGEIAVIDLDAAMKKGSNESTIKDLLSIAPCRVGGGIRDVETAVRWLDAGAKKVILGTRAVPEILRELPRGRVIAALDALNGDVVVEGWQETTGRGIIERIEELREFVSGFLVTFVEREGRLQGTNLDQVEAIVRAAGDCRVTIAGGITTSREIAELDRMGADSQVGMALYTGRLDFAESIVAPLSSDRTDGLWPTIVCDESGVALGLCWSNAESVAESVRTGRGVYQSRKRGLWRKGESSGAFQELLAIDLDCDRDALRFVVRQHGAGFCHLERRNCFGPELGIGELFRTLEQRKVSAPAGSYSKRLFEDAELLGKKLLEEAGEVNQANSRREVIEELADLLYFASVRAVGADVRLSEIEEALRRRSLKVTRRPGNAKS
ncbi:MAG: phosphoribosyl-ATP diphosphatase [Bdellovibrionota bacterium]